jgi:hypothetical protein
VFVVVVVVVVVVVYFVIDSVWKLLDTPSYVRRPVLSAKNRTTDLPNVNQQS